MTPRTDSQAFPHGLAWAVAQDGAAAHEIEVTALADLAIQQGLVPVAASVLADRTATAVVRQRAFGVVAAALAAIGECEAQPLGLADAA